MLNPFWISSFSITVINLRSPIFASCKNTSLSTPYLSVYEEHLKSITQEWVDTWKVRVFEERMRISVEEKRTFYADIPTPLYTPRPLPPSSRVTVIHVPPPFLRRRGEALRLFSGFVGFVRIGRLGFGPGSDTTQNPWTVGGWSQVRNTNHVVLHVPFRFLWFSPVIVMPSRKKYLE